jgi:protein-S-isoprenylcysteine O-methyltransferase Ste14
MKIPALPDLILLLFLGGAFVHFTMAGARVFYSRDLSEEPGALVGQVTFIFGGTLPVWWLGLFHVPIRLVNGIAAAGLMMAAIALYEWARQTIWSRRFGVGWGDHVPDDLCESGPYRWIRHPIYLAYQLAFLAAFVALPHWITLVLLAANVALFTHAARSDEATIASSALAAAYADYRKRAGPFWPKFNRAAPGR